MKMKAIQFDPIGGASGNMILASLVRLGCPLKHISASLAMLGLGKPAIRLEDRMVSGISCLHLDFDVRDGVHERSFRDIRSIINRSGLPSGVKGRAIKIFSCLTGAEAEVHGVSPDKVHFHEVGALDSIFDIVGIAAAVEHFSPEAVFTTPLPLSTGTVSSRHGMLPVPAPATLKLIEGMPARTTGIIGELVTPTGAAVIRALAADKPPAELIIAGSGYGCGTKSFGDWPNIFRSMLCETSETPSAIFVIESDIDDMVPEDWETALDAIRQSGALDACLINSMMKRGRPGVMLRVLAEREHLEAVVSVIFAHTTTIGVRYYQVSRFILERRQSVKRGRYGDVCYKEVSLPDGTRRSKPESRDIMKISRSSGMSAPNVRKGLAKK